MTNSQGYRKLTLKVLKYSAITILSAIILVFGAIAFVLNIVFTPAKLTEIVLNQTPDYIDGELKCEKIDLTFFGTFPNLTLELKNGVLIPSDSILGQLRCDKDTLISFGTVSAGINPLAFLKSNKVEIKKVEISDADIYAFINENGMPNWDIIRLPESTSETDTISDNSNTSFDSKIEIGSVEINRSNLTFDDRSTKVFFDMRSLDLNLSGNFSKSISDLKLDFKTRNIIFWQDGSLYLSKLAFGAESNISLDIPNHVVKIDKSVFEFNGMKIGAGGTLTADTLNKTVDVNIGFGMEISDLKTLVDLIPADVVKEAADASANGYFIVKGTVAGKYGKDLMPVIEMSADIENGSISYKGMPYSIEKLNLSANGLIDFEDKERSYFALENLHIEGASSVVKAKFRADNLLRDPKISSEINASVNFTQLASTFPLEEGVSMGGEIKTSMAAGFRMSDLNNKDFGKLDIKGFLDAAGLSLVAPKDSFYLDVAKAGLKFGANEKSDSQTHKKNLLNAIVGFDGLRLISRLGNAEADTVALTLKTSPLKDTTSIASVSSVFHTARLNVVIKDSVYLKSGKTTAHVSLSPDTNNKKIPVIKSDLHFESVIAGNKENIASVKNAGFRISSVQSATNKRYWISRGDIGFESMRMYAKEFPLLITMPASRLQLDDDAIRLHNAGVNIGSSDVRMQGSLSNLHDVFFNDGTLKGNLKITSEFIDCNQILKALDANKPAAEVTADNIDNISTTQQADTTSSMGVFVVPDKIDFTLMTDIAHVKFNNLDIEKIKGEMNIRNQAIELSNLSMHTLAADMKTSLVYKAADDKSAHTGFDLDMKDIRVGKLVEIIPALDTLVPMLNSLDGLVNFRIAAKADFDENMDVVIPSLQAATRVKGDSLVLMDGETFSEISKMLRFKNKEKNIVDSVSVDMVITNGMIEIYPFLIGMDRYLAAVGGKHNMDMTFNYHVSLLESPLPFKAGVDIKGNIDDFKFRITKAKYKDLSKSAKATPVDSTSVQVNNYIKHILQK